MNRRILVVDDTRNINQVVKLFLEKEGYDVSAFDNPISALKSATREEYGLYILDVMMPGIDGFTMTRILKNNDWTKVVPIILMSAKGLLVDTPKDVKYGIYGFIPKPFTKEILLKIVERSLLTAYQDDIEVE